MDGMGKVKLAKNSTPATTCDPNCDHNISDRVSYGHLKKKTHLRMPSMLPWVLASGNSLETVRLYYRFHLFDQIDERDGHPG